MIATIHQPQYLPWLGYFDKADRADIFIILDDVQYKKNEWQNRNKIKTPKGWQWLTIPVKYNFGQKITEVKISNETNWGNTHFKALELNYSRAPFFKDYVCFFESLYSKEWEYLVDINTHLIKKLIEFLGIKTQVVCSSQYEVTEQSTQRLIDLCEIVGADKYLSGVDGKNYMDYDKFKEHNIEIITQDFEHPKYRQLWMRESNNEFLSHLSVIDLLFNHGPESLKVIRGAD